MYSTDVPHSVADAVLFDGRSQMFPRGGRVACQVQVQAHVEMSVKLTPMALAFRRLARIGGLENLLHSASAGEQRVQFHHRAARVVPYPKQRSSGGRKVALAGLAHQSPHGVLDVIVVDRLIGGELLGSIAIPFGIVEGDAVLPVSRRAAWLPADRPIEVGGGLLNVP